MACLGELYKSNGMRFGDITYFLDFSPNGLGLDFA